EVSGSVKGLQRKKSMITPRIVVRVRQALKRKMERTRRESVERKSRPGRFGAEPCGGDAAEYKAGFGCRMCSDKVPSEAAFFVQVGILAELCVKADFTEARNAPDPADGVLIKDVVVADPKFERKTRAQRDETLEAEEVAYGPGSAAK